MANEFTGISFEVFENYLHCETKTYFAINNHEQTNPGYQKLQKQVRTKLFDQFVKCALQKQNGVKESEGSTETRKFFYGREIAFNEEFKILQTSFKFNVLIRTEGESKLGQYYYSPVLLCEDSKVTVATKQRLSFQAIVLAELQGTIPEFGFLIKQEQNRLSKINLNRYFDGVKKILKEISLLKQEDTTAPPFFLKKHCQICNYRTLCISIAKKEDHLSLIPSIRKKDVEKLNNKGIFTIKQYSYLFRPKKRKSVNNRGKVQHYNSLKALALRENKIYVFQSPKLKNSTVSIYLDVEGIPDKKFHYLIGILIEKGDSSVFKSFWANTKQEETKIFENFLEVIRPLDEYQIYHFGNYEKKFLSKMAEMPDNKYKSLTKTILNRSCDLYEMVYSDIYFPTYSNSLKDIANYLGFKWSNENSSGLFSILWRKNWELTKDLKYKAILLQYNKEDCLALKKLKICLQEIENKSLDELTDNNHVRSVTHAKTNNDYNFQIPTFANDDFNYINQCSYFDYQRHKVFLRSNKKVARRKKKTERKRKQVRINQKKTLTSRKCRHCGGRELLKSNYLRKKNVYDLLFFSGGVKKWITQYSTFQYKCQKCGKSFLPMKYKKIKKLEGSYRHNLVVWFLYNYVSNRMTYEQIQKSIQDYFKINLSISTIYDLKRQKCTSYKKTYQQLLKKIVSGDVIHADETEIKLQKTKGYVWVFSNMEEVIYLYKPSREGRFLKQMLKGFKGVLISDFYSAYNSIECSQQKCLAHLIRDLNDGFSENPFNNEYKELIVKFGELLRKIIETIDKFGLRKRNLRKHIAETKKFFDEIQEKEFSTESAQKLKRRLLKNRTKLFTFLDYNDVPWNNNNAETAIKAFSKWRANVKGRINEAGLNDYLILLSISQTCKYKEINFLEFLLSKETNLDRFLEKS